MHVGYADLQVSLLCFQTWYVLYGIHVRMDCGMHVRCSLPSLQWMTAGRGIVHSEMPGGDGNNIGLQLWINLKGKDKVK